MAQKRGSPWSREEVEATVADYLEMLKKEVSGEPYSKVAHNRMLQKRLSNRSKGSIESKHQNISAVLNEMWCGYIPGYKPRYNYQGVLREIVEAQLQKDSTFEERMLASIEREAPVGIIADWREHWVEPPEATHAREPKAAAPITPAPVRINFVERESRNRSLGLRGEEFVAEFESKRLFDLGLRSLSNRVEHVSKTRGDGLGYDVLSFERDGQERFIEVKTTAFGDATPFYVTRNELAFSEEKDVNFVLARVHEFRASPKLFELKGPIRLNADLEPTNFIAYPAH